MLGLDFKNIIPGGPGMADKFLSNAEPGIREKLVKMLDAIILEPGEYRASILVFSQGDNAMVSLVTLNHSLTVKRNIYTAPLSMVLSVKGFSKIIKTLQEDGKIKLEIIKKNEKEKGD